MAPYSSTHTLTTQELDSVSKDILKSNPENVKKTYFRSELRWGNVIGIPIFHIMAIYILLTFSYIEKFPSFLFAYVYGVLSGFGVTAGAHRLWCHRSYKATLPLRIALMIFYTMAGQNSIYDWVRDHRVHHKHTETSADPHDSSRGFFFAHVGWLMMKKDPDVIKKGRQLDLSDLLNDPVVKFQLKYFNPLKIIFAFILPISVPYFLWNEDLSICIMGNFARYCLSLNFTWAVNSAAHIFGCQPYDKKINPRENKIVSFFAMGEGWHNYHHTFPWDYKTGELGKFNVTAFWIKFFSKVGLAYDLKEPSQELVQKVAKKNGDGTYKWGNEVSERGDFS